MKKNASKEGIANLSRISCRNDQNERDTDIEEVVPFLSEVGALSHRESKNSSSWPIGSKRVLQDVFGRPRSVLSRQSSSLDAYTNVIEASYWDELLDKQGVVQESVHRWSLLMSCGFVFSFLVMLFLITYYTGLLDAAGQAKALKQAVYEVRPLTRLVGLSFASCVSRSSTTRVQ